MDPAIVYTERQSVVSLRTISSQCQYGPHYNGNGTNRERKNGGLGCGSVGRAVASNNRDLWFESGKWQISLTCNCVENTKIKMKEDGNGKIKKNLTHKQK